MDVIHRRCSGIRRTLLAGVASAVLAACASTPAVAPRRPSTAGDTSYRAVARENMQHYDLALGEISTGAVLLEHPAPVYPPSLLEARLPPQEVEALLIVDTEGRVSEVRMAGEAQAERQRRLFDDAVRAAALQWTFEPLRFNQWAADANGNAHEVSSDTRPFSQGYVFRFAWKNGQVVTDSSAAAKAAH